MIFLKELPLDGGLYLHKMLGIDKSSSISHFSLPVSVDQVSHTHLFSVTTVKLIVYTVFERMRLVHGILDAVACYLSVLLSQRVDVREPGVQLDALIFPQLINSEEDKVVPEAYILCAQIKK